MGFISKQKKKQFYTFVYQRDCAPFECNLTKVGLETDFYGNPQVCEADDKITKSENIYSSFIENLRKIDKDTNLNANECAAFLSHMFMRGKSTRSSLQELGESFYSASKEKIKSFHNQNAFFMHFVKNNRKELAKQIQAKLPSNLDSQQKMLLTKRCLDKPELWLAQFSGEDLTEITGVFDKIIDNIPNISKDSHIKALEESTTSKGVTRKLCEFNWQLLCQKERDYIFGDVGPICWDSKEIRFKKLIFINNEITSIYMPISRSQLLIGHKGASRVIPSINEINEAIAKLSKKFFISHSNRPEMKEISDQIGKEGNLVGEREKAILEEILKPLTPQ